MLTIKPELDGFRLEEATDGGKTFKFLSLATFRRCLLTDYVFDTGLLPAGTISFKQTSTGDRIALVQPGKIHKVIYEEENGEDSERRDFTVPMPPLLWTFELSPAKRLITSHVLALKTMSIVPNTMTYRAPLSNVEVGGRICWGDGGAGIDHVKSLAELSHLPDLFFSKAFNSDLNISHPPGGIRTLFEELHNKKDFPTNWLVEYLIFEEVWKK